MFFAFLSGSELLFVTVIVVVLFGASRKTAQKFWARSFVDPMRQ